MAEATEQGDSERGKRSLRWLAPIVALVLFLAVAIGAFMIATAGRSAASREFATAQSLDLNEFYDTPASSFVNGRFPWGAVPRGANTFGNIPLAIDGMICLWGESNSRAGLVFPEQSSDIGVDRKFETLYVYHCAFFRSAEGSPVYRLTMHYTDDSVREATICYGVHVLDWYQRPDEPISELSDPKSQIVWRGDPPISTPNRPMKLRFCVTSIRNPKPSLEVTSVSMASAKGNSAGCILAMTTGPADLLKPESGGQAGEKEKENE